MDWSRAKNVLIIIFAGLNIFLLINLSNYWGDGLGDETAQAMSVLKSRGIAMNPELEIPSYHKTTGKISIEEYEFDPKAIADALMESSGGLPEGGLQKNKKWVVGTRSLALIDSNHLVYTYEPADPSSKTLSKEEAMEMVLRMAASLKLPYKNFVLEDYQKNAQGRIQLSFVEEYKNLYIFDHYIKAEIESGQIVYYECRINTIKGTDNKKEIMPAYMILLKNLSDLTSGKIKAIDMGYAMEAGMEKSSQMSLNPVWRIKMEDGRNRFYNAYNGEKLDKKG